MPNSQLSPQELYLRLSDVDDPVPDLVPVSATDPLPVRIVPGNSFGYMAGYSLAATAYTLTVPPSDRARRLVYALVKYSAAPTEAGTTNVLTPFAGSLYATTLSTGAANTQSNAYVPGAPLFLLPGDSFAVTAPSGGGAIVAYVTIAWEWVS